VRGTDIAVSNGMSRLLVLPVMAMLLAEAPASEPPAEPVVPIGEGDAVAAPSAHEAPTDLEDAATPSYGGPAVAAAVAEGALLYGANKYQSDHKSWDAPKARTADTLLVISNLASGAVIHGLDHHAARAFGSIALRAGALLTGVLVTNWYLGTYCNADQPCSGRSAMGALVVGSFIGLPLAALALDDTSARGSWTPKIWFKAGLAFLGVGASF
jgi:hypothetical protein